MAANGAAGFLIFIWGATSNDPLWFRLAMSVFAFPFVALGIKAMMNVGKGTEARPKNSN